MNPTRLRRPLAALVLGGTAAFLGAVLPAHAFSNPPIQVAQGIEYMCGGAVKGEAEFMEMVAPRWAATIELGVSDGKGAQLAGFPAKASVQIRQKYTGQAVMDVETRAPYMLARLNPGAYDVNVTLGGLTLTQSLIVIAGAPARASFLWPSNFDMASVTPPMPQTQALAQTSAAR
ncbi:hypothetical protein [Variovorax sp. IB41]|jgi:hypothetical protein|uniref:hypothetical protein n=1 Tax=Variovorax sp. IB41 TaxID=2779370 RepID=UPI0018E6E78B|nr:hypothetical protein [Variovorax sp. IB41]MBJ2156000.1 hypothetical protein [Variovorax sp. IB41]